MRGRFKVWGSIKRYGLKSTGWVALRLAGELHPIKHAPMDTCLRACVRQEKSIGTVAHILGVCAGIARI
jgi:hypothetical protein